MNRAESEKFTDFMQAIDNADVDYTRALELLASIPQADRSTNLGEETLGDWLDRLERHIHERQTEIAIATEVAADYLEQDGEPAPILQFLTPGRTYE